MSTSNLDLCQLRASMLQTARRCCPETAEDAVQQALVKMVELWPRIRDKRTYGTTIVRHLAIQYNKKRQQRCTVCEVDKISDEGQASQDAVEDVSIIVLVKKIELAALRFVRSLEKRDRLILKEALEGKEYTKIAEKLCVDSSTVTRGIQQIKDSLEQLIRQFSKMYAIYGVYEGDEWTCGPGRPSNDDRKLAHRVAKIVALHTVDSFAQDESGGTTP